MLQYVEGGTSRTRVKIMDLLSLNNWRGVKLFLPSKNKLCKVCHHLVRTTFRPPNKKLIKLEDHEIKTELGQS